MDIQELRTFAVAARTENFRRTADLRFLSQAAVTQQVHRLEVELGVPLFDRHGRHVRLNAAGKSLLGRVERMLAEAEAAARDLAAFKGGGVCSLRLVVSPYVGRTLLPSLLSRYVEGRTDLEWSLGVRPSTDIPALVEEGMADLGVARVAPRAAGLRAERLQMDPFVLVMPHDGLDMDREFPSWEDVLAQSVILTHGPQVAWVAVRAAAEMRGIALRTMDVEQVDIAKSLVRDGLGISFLPLTAVQDEIRLGFLIQVPTPGLPLPSDVTYAILPAQPSAEAEAFLAFMAHRLRMPTRMDPGTGRALWHRQGSGKVEPNVR